MTGGAGNFPLLIDTMSTVTAYNTQSISMGVALNFIANVTVSCTRTYYINREHIKFTNNVKLSTAIENVAYSILNLITI